MVFFYIVLGFSGPFVTIVLYPLFLVSNKFLTSSSGRNGKTGFRLSNLLLTSGVLIAVAVAFILGLRFYNSSKSHDFVDQNNPLGLMLKQSKESNSMIAWLLPWLGAILLLVIVVVGGYYLLNKKRNQKPSDGTGSEVSRGTSSSR